MVDIEKERMRAALKIIAEKSCERLTTGPGSCWSQPAWTSESQYSDDRWCDGCIALAAILPPSQQPKRPSDPPVTARKCSDCNCMKDDIGDTYGWALCQCGSFRMPTRLESAFAAEPQRSIVEAALRRI